MKIVKLLRTAIVHEPDVVITLENPHAGMQCSHIMQVVEKPRRTGGLGLTKLTMDYCMHDGDGPRKTTDLWTDCKELIDAYAGGKFRCNHRSRHKQQVSSHVPGQSSLSRRDAARYPAKVAEFWAKAINREVKTRHAEQCWRNMSPDERMAQTFDCDE